MKNESMPEFKKIKFSNVFLVPVAIATFFRDEVLYTVAITSYRSPLISEAINHQMQCNPLTALVYLFPGFFLVRSENSI